jgi:hypothetical protein
MNQPPSFLPCLSPPSYHTAQWGPCRIWATLPSTHPPPTPIKVNKCALYCISRTFLWSHITMINCFALRRVSMAAAAKAREGNWCNHAENFFFHRLRLLCSVLRKKKNGSEGGRWCGVKRNFFYLAFILELVLHDKGGGGVVVVGWRVRKLLRWEMGAVGCRLFVCLWS